MRLVRRYESFEYQVRDSWLTEEEEAYLCDSCGFWFVYNREDDTGYVDALRDLSVAVLRPFDVGDAEVGLDELGTHLKRRFQDVYDIPSRRFEELVSHVYGQMGYCTRLTQQSTDGGFDVVLLERSSGEQLLVECKRYSSGRPVRIGIVRELLGVQVLTGVRRAKLVTTSRFTAPSRLAAVQAAASGYEIELIDAERLADSLGVYNATIPPLSESLPRLQPVREGGLVDAILGYGDEVRLLNVVRRPADGNEPTGN